MLKKGIFTSLILFIFPYKINDSINYHNYLIIDKLDIELEFFEINNKLNDVDLNIEVLKNSTMPDKVGTIVIAGHSGRGKFAYFNELDLLNINDEVILTYKNEEYLYIVDEIYNEVKDGDIKIIQSKTKRFLYLTTCNRFDKTKQLVIKCVFKE